MRIFPLAAVVVLVCALPACDGGEAACSSDADCSGDDLCVDDECVECESDRDCDEDEECNRDDECDRVSGEGEGEGEPGEGEGEPGEGEGEPGEGEGEPGEGEGEGEPGEGEGEPGEGEGEGEGEPTTAEAFCAHLEDDCGAAPPTQGTCVGNLEGAIDAAADQGEALCQQFAEALDTVRACQATAPCADIQAGTDCPDENGALGDLIELGALPCATGNAPVTIPVDWLCPASFFGVDDGCDCGCGASDADCADLGCTVAGCSEAGCDFCYLDEASAAVGDAIPCAAEGEGEGEGEATTAEAFCAHLEDDCGAPPPNAGTCESDLQDALDASAGQGDVLCQQLSEALDVARACQALAACADLQAGTACSTETGGLADLIEQGALPCVNGDAPVTIPPDWLCPASFFGVDDGCDCGCGAPDTDCLTAGCTIPGCNVAGCLFCYADEASATAGDAFACPPA